MGVQALGHDFRFSAPTYKPVLQHESETTAMGVGTTTKRFQVHLSQPA